MVEMEFLELRFDETSDTQIIILKEKLGDRRMPILIGFNEAHSIHIAINELPIQRPMTHDLTTGIVQAMGATFDRVVVTQLIDSTFYARIYFKTSNGDIDVDSRPSDAIALALRVKAPIFVSEEVLDQVAR